MNYFQMLVVPALAILAVLEVRAYLINRNWIHGLRLLVWCSAGVLVCYPEFAAILARALGIGRGTDLVFYGFAFTATGFGFLLYGRQHRLRRDLVTLARGQALQNPLTRDQGGHRDDATNLGSDDHGGDDAGLV
ncbi:MAG: DUF2304 domain-containing protein [Planctomycetota bacterium]